MSSLAGTPPAPGVTSRCKPPTLPAAGSDQKFRHESGGLVMRLRALQRLCFPALALAMLHGTAPAQDYPNRTITLVVPLAPGGAMDIVARTIGQKLSERLGKPVVIENRVGGGTGRRCGVGRKGAARRLHADVHPGPHADHQRRHLQEPAVRSAQRLHPDRAHLAGGVRVCRQSFAAGEFAHRVSQLREQNGPTISCWPRPASRPCRTSAANC